MANKIDILNKINTKLNTENEYYSKHIENLLDQIEILRGNVKLPSTTELRLSISKLDERVYYKNQEIANLKQRITELSGRSSPQYNENYWKSRSDNFERLYKDILAQDKAKNSEDRQIQDCLNTQAQALEQLVQKSVSPSIEPPRASQGNQRQDYNPQHTKIADLLYAREFDAGGKLWADIGYNCLKGESWQSNFTLLRDLMQMGAPGGKNYEMVQSMLQEMESFRQQIASLQDQNIKLDVELGQTKSDLEQRAKEIPEHLEKIEKLSMAKEQLQVDNRIQISDLQSTNEKLRKEVVIYKQEMSTMNEKIEQLTKSKESKEQESTSLSEKIGELAKFKDEGDEAVKSLEQERDSLQEKLESQKTQIEEQKSQIEGLKIQIEGQQAQIEEHKTQIEEQKSQISTLDTNIKTLNESKDKQTEDENVRKEKITDLKSKYKFFQRSEMEHRSQLQEAQSQIEQLHKEWGQAQEGLTNAHEENKQLKQILEKENYHVQSLQEEITTLTERNSSSERGALAYAESKIDSQRHELSRIKDDFTQYQIDFASKVILLAQQMETRFNLDSHRHSDLMRTEDPIKVLEALTGEVAEFNRQHGTVEIAAGADSQDEIRRLRNFIECLQEQLERR